MQNAGNPTDWNIANPRRNKLNKSFEALMKTLKEKLNQASTKDEKYYMLTITAPSSTYLLRKMETFKPLQYVNYVNIISYDLHGTWNEFVGPNASLFNNGKDAKLKQSNIYTTPKYKEIGYLNTD